MTVQKKAPIAMPGDARDANDAQTWRAARSQDNAGPAEIEADALAQAFAQDVKRFCAWRTETKKDRATKVPHADGRKAQSDNPDTWLTRTDAESVAARPAFREKAVDGLAGIGVFLGPISGPGGDTALLSLERDKILIGIDADTCRDPATGEFTRPWVGPLLAAIPSYAEISPSGTGFKIFAFINGHTADKAELSGLLEGKSGRQWKEPGQTHPPGIELYTSKRYFTFTGRRLEQSPRSIETVPLEALRTLIEIIGPSVKAPHAKASAKANGAAVNGARVEHDHDGGDATAKLEAFAKVDAKARRLLSGDLSDLGADKSASAVGWRLVGFCKDAGLSQGAARAVLRAYSHVDLRKYADDARQWSRIWDKVREDDTLGGDTLGGDNGDERAPLLINGADLTETAAAVTALLTKSPKLYHRDGPVTVLRDPLNETWATHPLTVHGVTRETHRHTRPFKRAADGGAKRDTLPERVAAMSLDDKEGWRGLRPIDGFATSPLLCDDGGIRTAEGYDATSRMFCADVPDVSVSGIPTRADAEGALLLLRTILRTFAFADAPKVRETFIGEDGKEHTIDLVDLTKPPGHDESAALHALITAVCRPCLWLAPAFVATAPNISGAGAGKGLLVRVICAIAFGLKPIAITAGHNAEEMEKRISTALIAAHQVLFLDNLNNRALKSDTLASAITERPSEIRIMRTSKSAKVAVASFIAITGNGLTVSEDMARRVLHAALDAGVEDPENREFPRWRPQAQSTSLLKEAFLNRAELLGAALTIWRWGRQSPDIRPGRAIGSFEDWARWVRDPLLTLGCADPAERIAATKASDPRRAAAAELFAKWNDHHGDRPVAVSDLHPEVHEIADPGGRGRQYLATRIRSFAGTRAGGFVLVHSPASGKWNADKFILKPTQAPGPVGPIGPTGPDRSPIGPIGPMGLDPVTPDNSGVLFEGEL